MCLHLFCMIRPQIVLFVVSCIWLTAEGFTSVWACVSMHVFTHLLELWDFLLTTGSPLSTPFPYSHVFHCSPGARPAAGGTFGNRTWFVHVPAASLKCPARCSSAFLSLPLSASVTFPYLLGCRPVSLPCARARARVCVCVCVCV